LAFSDFSDFFSKGGFNSSLKTSLSIISSFSSFNSFSLFKSLIIIDLLLEHPIKK
jgi:hypothetical protein